MNKNLFVEKSIQINADVSLIWDALTNPEKVKLYLFGTEVITDWQAGSQIDFQGEYQGQKYKDGGIILAIEKEKLIQYTYWSSFSGMENKEENYSIVTYKMKSSDKQTILSVTQQGFANEEAKQHSEQGWEMVLNKIKEITTK